VQVIDWDSLKTTIVGYITKRLNVIKNDRLQCGEGLKKAAGKK
jgi:hypothetical protein